MMKMTNFLKLAILTTTAFFCISGVSPRKEVQPVSEARAATVEAESKEKSVSQKPAQRKSAAQRSMEPESQTSMNQKSAAKRSME